MGIYLSDDDHDCLTNLRFADDVLLFASSEERLQKLLCEFKRITFKSGTQDSPRKDENSQQPKQPKKKKLKSMTLKSKY